MNNICLGHDIGIEAALVVLGFPLDHHVPYASRLIFEQWKDTKDKKYLRILLNGNLLEIENREFSTLLQFDSFLNSTFEKYFQLSFSWLNYQTVCTAQFQPAT